MHAVLLIFEFLGTTELLVIALVALVLFGPRKLPEIGRSLGKSLAEFKRASDDFKRTWEYEVEIEHRKPAPDAGAQNYLPGDAAAGASVPATGAWAENSDAQAAQTDAEGQTVARDAVSGDAREQAARAVEGVETPARQDLVDEDEINAS